ncbi:STC1 domain protein [Colletotrichum tofieldiae]|nr:STC1 domain protein [Colletotrichum tofieldiae]GKT78827.1 STC1 domain protein [Colletotrichum tofieldiae]
MSTMAPRPNGHTSFYLRLLIDITSPNNEGQKLPEKFRCKTGGEWKPWSSFSKKQQKLVQDKLSRRVRIDAANTGMVCRIHSGEPVKEIQCEGPCNRILVLDKFSKNNRTNGVNICKACQHWVNTQEPGYAPWAGPNTYLDPLEEMDDFETRLPVDPSDIFDLHDDRPLAPITGTDGLTGLEDDETDVPSLKLAGLDISRTRRNIVPPRLDTESVASTRQTTGSITSKTTAQSSSEDLGKTSLWLSQAKIAQAQPSGRVTYNAWDSNGRQYQMSKTPTVQSGQSSVASSIAGASSSRSQALGNNRPNAVSNSRLQQSTDMGKATIGGTWAGVANPDAGPAG